MKSSTKPAPNANPVIRLIGLGEAGVKLVETLAMIGPGGIETYSLDTDNRSLARCHQSKAFLLGQAIPCGLGTGGDSALARAAVESESEQLAGIVRGADLVFIVAGMGGGTGTGAASFLANLAKEAGALVVGVVATPFDCEGIRRCNQASGGVRDLKQVADAVFHFPNQDIVLMEGASVSLQEALDIANRHLCEAVLGVSRMLLDSGMLNVSFGDLQAALRGRHSLGSVIHVDASGDDRAGDAVRKLLAHPSALGGEPLQEASTLLVHLSGEDITMAEIIAVTGAIGSHITNANLVVGASGPGSEGAGLQATVIIAHTAKLAEPGQEQAKIHPDPTGESSDLGFSDSFSVPDTDSYLDLEKSISGTSRGGFAYTPPAPTGDALTPECREDLIRVAANEEPNRKKRQKIVQEMLPLEIVSKGRFEKSEPTIHQGEDLDQPTYIRRGAVLN